MRQGLLVVMVAALLGGCAASSTLKLENGLLIEEAGQTNMFRPSLSVMQVSKCQPEEGVTTVIRVDDVDQTCYGRFIPIAVVQGTQAGSLTGLGGAMIQGGSIVGAAYLLSEGIEESGSKTTNNNDTSSSGGTQSQGQKQGQGQKQLQKASSRSSAKGGSGGMGGSVNNGMPMAGRD